MWRILPQERDDSSIANDSSEPEEPDDSVEDNDVPALRSNDQIESLPFLPPGFESREECLQLSLEFIKVLEETSLDNGDMSEEALERLRNP
jgi:hypothetical protein